MYGIVTSRPIHFTANQTESIPKPVPDTDPDRIAALWKQIRLAMPSPAPNPRGGKRGRGRGHGRPPRPHTEQQKKRKRDPSPNEENAKKRMPIPQDQDPEDNDDQRDGLSDMTRSTSLTKVTSHSRQFRSLILDPRGITVEPKPPYKSPYTHFGTAQPPESSLGYGAIPGLDVAEVWLSFSNDRVDKIIEEYRCMQALQLCEREYAVFAMEVFLQRQSRVINTPTDRKWRPARVLELFAPPTSESSTWVAPPSFENSPDFKFDLHPDCTYWLSLAGFNSAYRSELLDTVYVHGGDWITCPYFTIEFKKHGQLTDQATWQACAAASLMLYNRYLLKNKALEAGGEDWTDIDRAQMKYYFLTFVGSQFKVWVLRVRFAEDSNAWDGCAMTNICLSACTSPVGVRKLESWINEIHRWGLTVHATGCHADVKKILRNSEVDTSAIDLEEPE